MKDMKEIILPNETDVINSKWDKAYSHFRQKLNERYNIDLSFKEYVLLTKERIDVINHTPRKDKCVGFLTIRGTKCLVVKEVKGSRFLSTALPYEEIN